MNKLRITMLVFIGLGLGFELWLAGKLLMARARVSDELRTAAAGSDQAVVNHQKARRELIDAQQAVDLANLSWGIERTVDANSLQVNAGRIAVSGLGRNAGLQPAVDPASNAEVPPAVHVFALDQGQSYYIGEFVADLPSLTDVGCILTPRWNATVQEINPQVFAGGARFRTLIPPGGRSLVENLRQSIQRANEQIYTTSLRIAEQKGLNAAAEQALEIRKRELLGDPDAADNADHPEYKLGLVQALEDLEEQRNAVQIAVDALRRTIKSALEVRAGLVSSLQQSAQQSSVPAATRVSQRPQ